MSKYQIIALFGESASGKDTIQKYIVSSYGAKGIVSCTTRPKRDYEKNGKDYYFLTNEEFAAKVLDGSMLEATEFNGWFYGTPIDALKENELNVGVFNPAGIDVLMQDSRLEVLPIYVKASDKTRLLRSLNREENPNCLEICRRFFADKEDFQHFEWGYSIIDNETQFNPHLLDWFIRNFDECVAQAKEVQYIYNNGTKEIN